MIKFFAFKFLNKAQALLKTSNFLFVYFKGQMNHLDNLNIFKMLKYTINKL